MTSTTDYTETTRRIENAFTSTLETWKKLAPDDPAKANVPLIDLADLPLRLFPTSALVDGIRIRPDYLRIALTDGGTLSANVATPLVNELFERLNVPERVSFRYSIFDSGRGIELQNQPIHNIAGLGTADGSRPFHASNPARTVSECCFAKAARSSGVPPAGTSVARHSAPSTIGPIRLKA